MRISVRQDISLYTFTPEAAIASLIEAGLLFAIILFFIEKWKKSNILSVKDLVNIFTYSTVIYLIAMKIIGFIVALIFGNIERSFNFQTFLVSMFSNFLDGFIYGSFFLTYYYYHKNIQHQKQLATYRNTLLESKIYHLKAQLNPHFLFNNLNVLDQLIEEDKHKASDFLNDFAEIYRYVLQASYKKVISIKEELEFAKQYFNLIQHKYGGAYIISIQGEIFNGYIVPLTLQLLIENAIQHNLGSIETPVIITINIGETICISNNVSLKNNPKLSSGRALKNLKEQYQLLTNIPLLIKQTGYVFEVTLPIIPASDI